MDTISKIFEQNGGKLVATPVNHCKTTEISVLFVEFRIWLASWMNLMQPQIGICVDFTYLLFFMSTVSIIIFHVRWIRYSKKSTRELSGRTESLFRLLVLRPPNVDVRGGGWLNAAPFGSYVVGIELPILLVWPPGLSAEVKSTTQFKFTSISGHFTLHKTFVCTVHAPQTRSRRH